MKGYTCGQLERERHWVRFGVLLGIRRFFRLELTGRPLLHVMIESAPFLIFTGVFSLNTHTS